MMAFGLQAQSLEITLDQVEELSRQYSPVWQQLEKRLAYDISGERSDAARINPSIAYNLEFLNDGDENLYEHDFFLQKEFRTPGHFRSLQNLRDIRIRYYEQQTEMNRTEFLASARLGFVRIVLLEKHMKMVESLTVYLDRLQTASARITEEGETSLIDNRMIEMSNFHLQAIIDGQAIELQRMITAWRILMGIHEETDLNFSGTFELSSVNLPDSGQLFTLLDESPRLIVNQLALESAGYEIQLQENRRIPSFELSAGYKQLTPVWRGFLVGFAIPLPLLSRNTDSIEQSRSLQRMEQLNLEHTRREQNQTLLHLVNLLESYEVKLAGFPDFLDKPQAYLNSLAISYQEGTHTLSEFLNTLSLMADSYQTRFNQLQNYYSIAAEIEAITGQKLIYP